MKHLKDRDIGYFTHMLCALKYSIKLYFASQVLLIHAIVPSLFETTASDIIKKILEETSKCSTD
jgi:hypothetical protein